MDKNFQLRMLKKLSDLAPKSPSILTKKNHSDLINQLIQLTPKWPYKRVSGIKKIQQIKIPTKPDTK